MQKTSTIPNLYCIFLTKLIYFQLTLSNTGSSIAVVVNDIDKGVEDINNLLKRSKLVTEEVSEHLSGVDETRKTLEELFHKLNILETTLQYFKVIRTIESLR